VWLAERSFDVAAGRIEPGTVAAMHAVHAIAPVCAAAPGIKTFLDLPTILGRHVLRRGR